MRGGIYHAIVDSMGVNIVLGDEMLSQVQGIGLWEGVRHILVIYGYSADPGHVG